MQREAVRTTQGALSGDVLASGHEMLQLGLVLKGDGNALLRQIHDLRVAVAGSGPASTS